MRATIVRAAYKLITLPSERGELDPLTEAAEAAPVPVPVTGNRDDLEDRLARLEKKLHRGSRRRSGGTLMKIGAGAIAGAVFLYAYGLLNRTTYDIEHVASVAQAFATGEAHIGTVGTDMQLDMHLNRKTPIIDVKPDYDSELDVYTEVDLAFPSIVNGDILDVTKTVEHHRGRADKVTYAATADASRLELTDGRVSFDKSSSKPYKVKDSQTTRIINWVGMKDRSGIHGKMEAAMLEYAEVAAADPQCVSMALGGIAVEKGLVTADASREDQVNAGIRQLLNDAIVNSIRKNEGEAVDPSTITVDITGVFKADGINGKLKHVLAKHGFKSGQIQRQEGYCDASKMVYTQTATKERS